MLEKEISIEDFSRSENTFVMSDIHLTDAEPPHPQNPYWKRYKRPRYFVDRAIKHFLERIEKEVKGKKELILNGDIFDFDSVMAIPEKPDFNVTWLEKRRGLRAEEPKSKYKMKVIMEDHPIFVEAIRDFVMAGNRVVFIIGNHDMELHWPGVQAVLRKKLRLPDDKQELVRFCEWFYISNRDTLIEHGNQYDTYCACSNPIHPLIKRGSHVYVRLPMGNIAAKIMMNGIGLLNPHAESFVKSIWEYLNFFYKYMMRTQPFILWTWFWTAIVTGLKSISEGLLPAMKDPLYTDTRVETIAKKANSKIRTVWSLKEVGVHPAIFNPVKVLRELWLDRAILLLLILLGSFQFFTVVNVFVSVSFWWVLLPFTMLMPFFIFYARSVESDIVKTEKGILATVPLSARIANVHRVIHGHTHRARNMKIDGVHYLNTGTWSPAFKDVECTQPYGKKCFAWIHPDGTSSERVAELFEWKDNDYEKIPIDEEEMKVMGV